jgi:hypothetical protein
MDNNRHRFERQPHKKNKKASPQKKFIATLHTFAFACHRTNPTHKQSQKSAIANALPFFVENASVI